MDLKRRGFNKKGAEGFSLGFFASFIFVIFVLILVVLWASGVFDTLSGGTSKLPQDLELQTQACVLAVQGGFRTAYCKEFKEVDILRKSQYINCEYGLIQEPLLANLKEKDLNPIDCGDNEALDFCEQLDNAGKLKDDLLVNGETCESYGYSKKIEMSISASSNVALNSQQDVTVSVERVSDISRTALKQKPVTVTVSGGNAQLMKKGDTKKSSSLQGTTDDSGNFIFVLDSGSQTADITVTASIDASNKVSETIKVGGVAPLGPPAP